MPANNCETACAGNFGRLQPEGSQPQALPNSGCDLDESPIGTQGLSGATRANPGVSQDVTIERNARPPQPLLRMNTPPTAPRLFAPRNSVAASGQQHQSMGAAPTTGRARQCPRPLLLRVCAKACPAVRADAEVWYRRQTPGRNNHQFVEVRALAARFRPNFRTTPARRFWPAMHGRLLGPHPA